MTLRSTAIRALQIIHVLVLVFVIGGPLLPSRSIWIVHVAFVPLMFLHWKMNRNRCVLTQIEAHLKGEREVSESGFIAGLWKKIFGKQPSARTLQRLINSILVATWIVSLARLIFSQQ